MNTAVLLPAKYNPESKLCSNQIAAFIAETLGCDFIHGGSDKIKEYENLILVNFPFAFCDMENEVEYLVSRCRRLIWVQNDYTIIPPLVNHQGPESPIRRAFGDRKDPLIYWTTVPENVKTKKCHYVNFNFLGWKDDIPMVPIEWRRPKVIYYGSYRKDRETSFQRYLSCSKIVTACTTRNWKKFGRHTQKLISPLGDIYQELQNYSASLYIEDEEQHGHHHSPPSRFYEAASTWTPLLIDRKCVVGLKMAGVHVSPDWVVRTKEDIENITKIRLARIQKDQRMHWSKNYLTLLRNQINEAYQKAKA